MIDWYLPALTNAQLRVDLLPMNLPDHPSAPAPSGPYVAHGSWLWSGGARRRDPPAVDELLRNGGARAQREMPVAIGTIHWWLLPGEIAPRLEMRSYAIF
jgi:hypothetical protein